MLHSNEAESYKCIAKTCIWNKDRENIDWGYFTNQTGNCKTCINLCDKEEFCQAVECGNNDCAWWKNDECNVPSQNNAKGRQTCIKMSLVKGKLNQTRSEISEAVSQQMFQWQWQVHVYIILEIVINDYVGLWKRIGSESGHACHQINDKNLECKSAKSAPQILTISGRNVSWTINGGNLVINGTYIGNDVIRFRKTLWVKQGNPKYLKIEVDLVKYKLTNNLFINDDIGLYFLDIKLCCREIEIRNNNTKNTHIDPYLGTYDYYYHYDGLPVYRKHDGLHKGLRWSKGRHRWQVYILINGLCNDIVSILSIVHIFAWA